MGAGNCARQRNCSRERRQLPGDTMKKAHCDNCDAVIIDANPLRLVTVQPLGFQCVVGVTIRKETDLELCAGCLRAAAMAFAESLRVDARQEST